MMMSMCIRAFAMSGRAPSPGEDRWVSVASLTRRAYIAFRNVDS